MTNKVKDNLATIFYKEVTKRAKAIDPLDEQDWYSLSLGWAIAKGLSPANAHEFSLHIRYAERYEML